MTRSVAIVGAGIIGANHAEAIRRHPDLRVGAIVDPDAEAAKRLAGTIATTTGSAPGVYATLPEALAGVDIAVLTSPSGTHADLAEQALAGGVHLVIEKPLDASLPAARRIAAAAAASDRVVSVICQHRFDPASVAVAEAVHGGAFGRITSAVASVAWWRGQPYYDSAGWRGTWALDGGGATMNQGVHTVDLLLWLLGRPVEVYAQTGVLAHERIEVEDVAVATVRFASGALAVLHATTAAYPGLSVRLAVHGAAGSAVIDDDRLVYFRDAPVTPEPADPDAFTLGHLRQWDDIAAAVRDHRPPGVTVADGLLDVAVVKAVYVAAHLGRPVRVDAVLAGDHDDDMTNLEQGVI